MNTEFLIDIGGEQKKLYMQIGFFEHEDLAYPLHKHAFAEMHILLNGNAVLKCNNQDVPLGAANALIVPANTLHKYQLFTKDSKRITFFIDDNNNFKQIKKTSIPSPLITLLCEEIQKYVIKGNDSKLKALLSYICSDFLETETIKTVIPIANRELIIEDFFSRKYNKPVTLKDLANELMLSPKQTEREVKRITGNTFTFELTKRRLDAAAILSKTTNLSLTEISKLVGYTTYCGFYKAYKKRHETPPINV